MVEGSFGLRVFASFGYSMPLTFRKGSGGTFLDGSMRVLFNGYLTPPSNELNDILQ